MSQDTLIRVRVLGFAAATEALGCADFEAEFPVACTVQNALDQLCAEHPSLLVLSDALATAVNLAYVTSDHVLHDGDELALIPPVSGG